MLKVAQVQPLQIICLLCGRPAGTSICECCIARVQGQAIDQKRQAEKRSG